MELASESPGRLVIAQIDQHSGCEDSLCLAAVTWGWRMCVAGPTSGQQLAGEDPNLDEESKFCLTVTHVLVIVIVVSFFSLIVFKASVESLLGVVMQSVNLILSPGLIILPAAFCFL